MKALLRAQLLCMIFLPNKNSSGSTSYFFRLILIQIILGGFLPALAEISIDEPRSSTINSSDSFEEPFLVTKTTKKFAVSAELIYSQMKSRLKSGQLVDIKDKYVLPPDFFEESQQEALRRCNLEKCLIKLSSSNEIPNLKNAKNKIEAYQAMILKRLRDYADSKQLMGYEDRKSNSPFYRKMVNLLATLEKSPSTMRYLKSDFWKGLRNPGQPVDSWFRHEMVNIAPDQMQPILRVSEDTEYFEGERKLFLEVHIYTNHYFDSSLTLYEIVSDRKKKSASEVIVTDIMEIDELKKTALIRAMFTGKMVKAVTTYQTNFLESLDSNIKKP